MVTEIRELRRLAAYDSIAVVKKYPQRARRDGNQAMGRRSYRIRRKGLNRREGISYD